MNFNRDVPTSYVACPEMNDHYFIVIGILGLSNESVQEPGYALLHDRADHDAISSAMHLARE